ncbi:hypothetical protein DVC42_23460 [Salmonella enterica]|nr:hypothetical protein [Salmonella enterica]
MCILLQSVLLSGFQKQADGDIILLGGLAEQSDGLFWPLTCRRLQIVQSGITTVLPEEAIKYGK